jgi:crotonobetainyl-CoA:carnitine CoA-transferase CaiB-like acyl-CoA transferase
VATGLDDAVPGPPLAAPGPPFGSADGHWFEIETLETAPWTDFWARLGVGPGPDVGRAWTQFRWRYERARCSLPPELHQATQARTLAELRQVAVDSGVSLAVVRDYRAVLADRPPAFAVLGLADGGAQPAPPHAGGGDLPLAGIRMVEATNRIQGPFAGMLLRMLGAEVVRVQPPEGDYGRAALTLHRGKQAVTLDLATAGGRADLVELVAGADVFLHNWRPGKSAEWGLEPADLARRRPGLVYASTSGWGDRPEGRLLVGTDFLVQAHAAVGDGMHPVGRPAVPSRLILCDLFGALVTAEGILAGLDRSQETGRACEVRSSLLAGAMALQAHVLDAMAEGTEEGRRDGRPLWTSLDHPIPTADGHVVLSAGDDESLGRLRQLYVDGPSRALGEADVERGICVRIRESVAATEEKRLLDAGIPAAVVCGDLADVPADPRFAGMFEPVGIGDAAVAPRTPWAFR